MKRITTFNEKAILNFIFSSKKLSEKLKDYIYNTEFDYINEKLDCFDGVDYSIGLYNRNYLTIKNSQKFINGVSESIYKFGCSNKLDKLYKQCEKLRYTNLFEYMCKKLCAVYYKEEIETICNDVERLLGDIDNNKFSPILLDYVEYFADCYLQNIYINNDSEIIEIVKH